MALDQNGLRNTRHGNRGREKQRAAGNDVFGLFDVGNDLFARLFRARAYARERERRGHQLQELAAAFRVVPLGRLLRELTMQVFAELRRVCQLAQAAPVQAAVRPRETRFDWRRFHALSVSGCRLPACSFRLPASGTHHPPVPVFP
jgi:hypothetical protein